MTYRRAVVNAVAPVVESVETRRLFAAPVFDGLSNVNVPTGKTLQIPLTSTSDAGTVSYSFRDTSTGVSETLHPSTDTFIQMNVQGYSQPMVFELFNDVAPDSVRRISGLVNAGYFDGLTFHRIIKNFVIQGGDPNGDGSGGTQAKWDDEYDINTTFTGTGQLALANSGQDTNQGQFFITEGPQRALDFNYTIFGQLVRGESTRLAISNTPGNQSTGTPTGAKPVITSVRIIKDVTDGVMILHADATGSFNVKVTATNADGSTSHSFTSNAAVDTINDPPILTSTQKVYYTTPGVPVTVKGTFADPDASTGDFVSGQFINQNGGSGTVNGDNTVTITPAKGPVTISLGALVSGATTRGSAQESSAPFNGIADTETVTIATDAPISATAAGFSTTSGATLKGITVATFRSGDAADTASNFTASIDWGDGTLTAGVITKNARGIYSVTGTKTYAAKVAGAEPLTVTITGDKGAYQQVTALSTIRSIATLTNGVLTINGTSGRDRLGISRKSRTYIVSNDGASTSFATSDVTSIQMYGFDGNDSMGVAATVYAPTYLDGGTGNDTISGGSGDDVINGAAGDDLIFTGDGSNRVGGAAGNDTITGGNGRDRLGGGDGNDSLIGGAGRDILSGDAGADILQGGTSNDSLYGGNDNDILNGNGGADYLDGGAGRDTVKDDPLDTRVNIEVK